MPGIMHDESDFNMISNNGLRHTRSSPKSSSGRQSLLSAMNQFVSAVDEMDGAVMIPCKLQDMHLTEGAPLNGTNGVLPPLNGVLSNGHSAIHNGNGHLNNGSVAPPMNGVQKCPPVTMNGTHNGNISPLAEIKALVPIPEEPVVNSAPKEEDPKHTLDPKHMNLYTYYGMLRAIKEELVRGPSPDGKEPEDEEGQLASDGEDDIAKQTATMFRHHLRGLFDVLQSMTTTADQLTTRYQSEIGDNSLSSTRSMAQYTLKL